MMKLKTIIIDNMTYMTANKNKSNLLINKYSELVKREWDYEKNKHDSIDVNKITYGSGVKAWWRCETYKHSYQMPVFRKTCRKPRGCPYCSGQKVLKGFNDLASCYTEIAKEWYQPLNGNITPDMITKGNLYITIPMNMKNKTRNEIETIKVKPAWKCSKCGYIWQATAHDRTNNHSGCPACAGKKVLKGINDLQTLYTKLIQSEWNWSKNNSLGIKPSEITHGSKEKAWWKCSKCKHEWQARIDRRTTGSGCPACAKRISKQENQVADYINNCLCSHYAHMDYNMFRSIKFKKVYEMKKIKPDDVLSNVLQSHLLKELDIYIPELNLAVEYDGDYWHDDKVMRLTRGMTNEDAHMIKQELCNKAGITLLIVKEHDWINKTENVKKLISKQISMLVK